MCLLFIFKNNINIKFIIMTTSIDNLDINIEKTEKVDDLQDPLVKELLNNMSKNISEPQKINQNISEIKQIPQYISSPPQIIYKKDENYIDYNILLLSIMMFIIVILILNSSIITNILDTTSNEYLINNELYVKYILIIISFYMLQKNK
jgi:hypothetical protein